jgi:hypothetical protein
MVFLPIRLGVERCEGLIDFNSSPLKATFYLSGISGKRAEISVFSPPKKELPSHPFL